MNNIYKITFKEVSWDEMDGLIIIAKNRKHALEIMLKESWCDNMNTDNVEYFRKVGESRLKPQILLYDFNQG